VISGYAVLEDETGLVTGDNLATHKSGSERYRIRSQEILAGY
jgi:hypothetical protein